MSQLRHLRPLPLALSVLLAACTTTPGGVRPSAPVVPEPAQKPTVTSPVPNVELPVSTGDDTASDTGDVWERLRDNFAMSDCDADPNITAWARRFTQNPGEFESQIGNAAPRIAYVEHIAAAHNVPGEFALLPWVESHYRSVSGKKNMPAGMWQIMPVTANALGLHVDRNFDGRMDVPAATDAIMALLARYHDEFHDWRLVDYAFNVGEFGIKHMVNGRGPLPDEPTIPKLPVKLITREHLTKLLAISCVIRDPQRFHVSLPTVSADQELVKVSVNNSMPLTNAANHAGMSVSDMQELNAAFRNGQVDASASTYLLMPSAHAEQFRSSLLSANDTSAQQVPGTAMLPPLAAALSAATPDDSDDDTSDQQTQARKAITRMHTVKPGETLSGIAHRYAVDLRKLQQWNHLKGTSVKPGQVLKVGAGG